MISEGSCDTEDRSNDVENSTSVNIEHFLAGNFNNISQYYFLWATVFFIKSEWWTQDASKS